MEIFKLDFELLSTYRGNEMIETETIAHFSHKPILEDLKSVLGGNVEIHGHKMSDDDFNYLALNGDFHLQVETGYPAPRFVISNIEVIDN